MSRFDSLAGPSAESLTAVPQERQREVLAWLDTVFRPNGTDGFAHSHPHLFRRWRGPSSHILEHRGRILGHIGIHRFQLKTSIGTVPVVGIGQVAVAPEARGQGLMGLLMEQAHEIGRREGAVLSLLGGIRQLYTKSAYEICGLCHRWMWGGKSGTRTELLERVDSAGAPAMRAAWLVKPCGVQWEEAGFMGLLERKDWIPYVYRAAGGSAYCFAKTSVSPTVVEWGGGDDALLVPMMEAVAARHGPFLVLRQPWQTPPLYPVMVDSGMDISVRMLGMLKILNPEVLGAYCTNSAKTPDGMLDDLGDLPSASCEEQRRFIRKYFGDPFGQYTPSSMVIWDWEEVSYV